MQTIERYGVIVLLLCAVSIGAVWMFEKDAPEPGSTAVAKVDRPEGKARVQANRANETRAVQAANRSDEARVSGRLSAPVMRENLEEFAERTKNFVKEGSSRLSRLAARKEATEPTIEPNDPVNVERGEKKEIASSSMGLATETKERSAREAARQARLKRQEELARKQAERSNKKSSVEPSGDYEIYVVAANDTLSQIAESKLGTWRRMNEIAKLNPGVDMNRIMEGMRLKLPTGAALAATSTKSEPAGKQGTRTKALGANQVRVQSGDSLWSIAERELKDGTRYLELARLNPAIDPDHLMPGQVVTLPTGPAPKAKRSSAPKAVAQRTPSRAKKRGKVL